MTTVVQYSGPIDHIGLSSSLRTAAECDGTPKVSYRAARLALDRGNYVYALSGSQLGVRKLDNGFQCAVSTNIHGGLDCARLVSCESSIWSDVRAGVTCGRYFGVYNTDTQNAKLQAFEGKRRSEITDLALNSFVASQFCVLEDGVVSIQDVNDSPTKSMYQALTSSELGDPACVAYHSHASTIGLGHSGGCLSLVDLRMPTSLGSLKRTSKVKRMVKQVCSVEFCDVYSTDLLSYAICAHASSICPVNEWQGLILFGLNGAAYEYDCRGTSSKVSAEIELPGRELLNKYQMSRVPPVVAPASVYSTAHRVANGFVFSGLANQSPLLWTRGALHALTFPSHADRGLVSFCPRNDASLRGVALFSDGAVEHVDAVCGT